MQQIFHQKHKTARQNWEAPKNFPGRDALHAYTKPLVDGSKKQFTWGDIDVEGLRHFCESFILNFDETMDPVRRRASEATSIIATLCRFVIVLVANSLNHQVLKQIQENKKNTQQSIESYFTRYEDDRRFAKVNSKRLRSAIKVVTKGGKVPGLNDSSAVKAGVDENSSSDCDAPSPSPKKKKGNKTTVARPIKNARTAYLFFSQSERARIAESENSLTFGEISKVVSKNWKEIKGDDLMKFQQLANEDKQRYRREKTAELNLNK